MSGKENRNFIISKENWSLHRKGYQDQRRHQEKVQEAVKKNLPDLITEENIIMSRGKEVVRIPIRSVDEYKIRYNMDNNKYTGQGDGDSQEGDVIARDPGGKPKKGGAGSKPGDKAGEDFYEAEVSILELEQLLFNEMELPNLQKKQQDDLIIEDIEFNDIRKKGLMGNIDKRRTILSAIRRNAMKGKPNINPIFNEDLRFKTWNEKVKPESKAVVIAMMDTSGSMGRWEKFMARSFFFWMVRFLRTKYETVELEFIAHHTEAKSVNEEDFFSKAESGGTICSSAYEKALETIENHYSPALYNIYPFHFSDGDNLTSDNPKCLRLINELMELSSMVGYAEVNQYQRHSTLLQSYRKIHDKRFRHFILKQKGDVFEALKWFFAKEEEPQFV
ncbi:sporulation protein YhbH [Salibacterium salarium]|uniref:Sporulation protein YhbH n=1 Tax=Salibacterium salarium TaxID=284579 RepID=A0A3R9PZS9_9BACI|nr:sporulation protein YhbH [Salibacterium salarium]RSL30516.1 sporulation protein YhbH [Salibacterium salarium]